MSKKRLDTGFLQFGGKEVFELEGDVGIFGGVLGDLGEGTSRMQSWFFLSGPISCEMGTGLYLRYVSAR